MIKNIINNIKLWMGQKDLESAHVKLSTCGRIMTECYVEEHGNSVTFHSSDSKNVKLFLEMFNTIKGGLEVIEVENG